MRTRQAGFTLIELIVSIVVASVVLGAAYRMLTGNQRFYRAQSQIVDVQQNIRAISQILPGELRELCASCGDIVAMSDTSIEIRAMRGFSVVCAPPVPATGTVVLRNSLLFGYRAIDPTRDHVFVFRDGDTQKASDDQWLQADISASGGSNCADGTPGTRLTLVNMTGGLGQLGPGAPPDSGVTVGSPVRVWEQVNYQLQQAALNAWWLRTRSLVSGTWTSFSSVAGPLRGVDGLDFNYFDAAGVPTANPADVAMIDVTARGRSVQPINVAGRRTGHYEDSVTVRVTLRNN